MQWYSVSTCMAAISRSPHVQLTPIDIHHCAPRQVWNFPIDISFKSTNAHGWPQLVVSVYGMDALSRDIIRGYGRVHLPISPGRYTKHIRLFAPAPSSMLQGLRSWIYGTPPEFINNKFIAGGEGREAVRVNSEGLIRLQFNIVTKNMAKFGYSDGLG